jgi:hypothetical protein
MNSDMLANAELCGLRCWYLSNQEGPAHVLGPIGAIGSHRSVRRLSAFVSTCLENSSILSLL